MVLPDSHRVPRDRRYSGKVPGGSEDFAYGTVTLCGAPSQTLRLSLIFVTPWSLREGTRHLPLPRPHIGHGLYRAAGLGCFLFARRYWGNRICFLFLQVLRCFSSLRCPPMPMDSAWDDGALPPPGCPFGDPRVKGLLHLTVAYRSLTRPSSALSA